MTLLQAGSGGFVNLVSQYFLSIKGRGLMLSPKEMALVLRWKETGVPVDVVCRAIKDSVDSFSKARGGTARAPSSLLYCAPAVDEAIAAWRHRMVGRNPVGGRDDGM